MSIIEDDVEATSSQQSTAPPSKKLRSGLFGSKESRARMAEVIAREDRRKPDAPIVVLNAVHLLQKVSPQITN